LVLGLEAVIHIDTHVAAWLYAGRTDLLPAQARRLLEENPIYASPMVMLELQYLHEIGRIDVAASEVMTVLERLIGLEMARAPFADVARQACLHTWTRDPFDRIIVAQAQLDAAPLLTKDASIRRHYSAAVWNPRA
jgi:PIN domain nuclease of toxin-antitoxin system